MSRSARRASTRPFAWLLGLLIPVGLVVGIFALASPRMLTGKWPLGIATKEVRTIAKWKGRVLEGDPVQTVSVYQLETENSSWPGKDNDSQWRSVQFRSGNTNLKAEIASRGPVPGAVTIRFSDKEPFELQHQINLVPATIQNIRANYLSVIATELKLPVPEITYVRVVSNGTDLGIYQKEEAIDRSFLAKQRMSDATLFYASSDPNCPQGMFPYNVSDTLMEPELRALWNSLYAGLVRNDNEALATVVDQDASIAWLLMRWVEHGDPTISGAVPYVHRRTTGTIAPIYQRTPAYAHGRGTFVMDPASALLQRNELQQALTDRRNELVAIRWRMKEKFAEIDRKWLPVLAVKGDLAYASGIAQRIAEELLEERLVQGDPIAHHQKHWVAGPGRTTFVGGAARMGPVLMQATDGTTAIEHVARRYITSRAEGDTLVLDRGKYYFDEELVLPPGKALVINEGARITMGPGSSITVQGPLHIRGSRLRPVFIRAASDAQPFDVIAMRGDGKVPCRINGLYISGGAAQGTMVSIRGALDAVIAHCDIESTTGHALQILGGTADLNDVDLKGGSGPLLAFDHVRSVLTDCSFVRTRNTPVGTGIEIKGERTYIGDCRFAGMTAAAIIVGEAGQVLVEKSTFDSNARAIEGSDLAMIHVSENRFTNNAIVFKLQRIDPIKGGARVVRYANELTNNQKESEADDYSGVDEKEVLDPKIAKDLGAPASGVIN